MKKKTTVKKLHRSLGIRFAAILLCVSLLATSSLPERFCMALFGERGSFAVNAGTMTDELLMKLVSLNFSDAGRYNDITAEIVEKAFRSNHVSGSLWSNVIIPGFMYSVGEAIADRYPEPEEGQEPAADTVFKNPWSEASENSAGSPYSPGKDYLGNDMNAAYSMGQLIIDYTRQSRPGAAYLSDEAIVEIYDILVGNSDDADPFVDMDSFLSQVDAAIAGAGAGAYDDQPVTEVLDYSRYITYGEYVINRGSPVPAGYLFIGTWLMDAQAINSTFYRAAVNSMGNDDQQIMYYKSELAGNNWRNIYGASGLEAILSVAENVQEYTLVNYYVSVVVGADGIPRWAKTGELVDIFSINDPYNLDTLPELKSLKVQYDAGVVTSTDGGSKQYVYDRITQFFRSDGKIERSAQMEADCRYVLNVANRTGIAFYAPDYAYTNWYTSALERYYCNSWVWRLFGYQGRHRSGIGISETFGAHQWRFEESGRGFLESLETQAERGVKNNFVFTYSIDNDNLKGYYPSGGGEQDSNLIRGWPSWTNEVAWVNEVNAFGGIGELRRRFWSFEDLWRNFSSIQDEVTDDYDRRLASMGNIYYEVLHFNPETGVKGASSDPAEDKELADEVLQICEQMDAGRRARAYYNLVDNSQHNYIIGPVLNLLYQWVAYGESNVGRNYNLLYYTDEDFAQVSSITEAVENAIQSSQSSYIKYQNLVPTEGNTILSQARYELINSVVDNAGSGAPAVRSQLRELVDLGNIENNVIAHKSRELNYVNVLLDAADSKYQLYLHAASGDDYRSAAGDPNTTASLLEELLQDQKADVTGVGAELQRLIKARAIRLDTDDAINFIVSRIDWAERQRPGITTDAFGPYAKEALDEHIKWLRDLLNTIREGGEITDETDDLRANKAQLELDLLNALDNGNLKEAESLGRKITEVQKAIDQADKKKQEKANSGSAGPAEQLDQYNPESLPGVADKIADDLLASIGEGNLDPVPDGLNALAALGSPRIPEITEALKLHSAPLDLIHQAEAAAEDAEKSPYSDLYNTGDNAGGAGGGGTGTGGSGDSDGNGNGGPGGPGGTGTGGQQGDNSGGNGDDGNGGNGENDGNGNGSGDNDGNGGNGDNGDGFGKDLGLSRDDLGNAINAGLGGDLSGMSDLEKAAAVAALEQFALARDDSGSHDYAMDLVNELLASAGGFIYKQYLSDTSTEYVSLESVDKCRLYTRFRRARERADITMAQIVQGSATYSFAVDSTEITKNNGDVDNMDLPLVTQTDPYIRGDSITAYPYISEAASMKYLYCKCVYLKGTELAVLVTPQMDSKIVRILDELDALADGDSE